MAYEILRQSNTLIAASDLSAKQFFFVDVNTSGQATLAGANANAIGVLQNKPTSLQSAAISGAGSITKVVCGATVTSGDQIMVDSTGRAVTATAGNFIMGRALASGTVGQVISMLQNPAGKA